MAGGVNLGEAFVLVKANLEQLEKGLQGATKKITSSLEKAAKQADKVGDTLTKNLTLPIVALGALAAKNFDESIRAQRQLAAVIKNTGGDVEAQLEAYKQFAGAMQSITLAGDDATIQNIQVARSMGLTAEQAARAAKNAVAATAAFGLNAETAVRMTAALEQGETSMLTRYIPTLRAMEDETARAALAQKILADNFVLAQEEASVGLGPLKQLWNSLGDLSEQFGQVILEGINPTIIQIRKFVDSITSLDRRMVIAITSIAGAVAVLGPAMKFLAFSFSGLSIILKVFLSRLFLIPTAVIAGVVALDALGASTQNNTKFWDEYADRVGAVAQTITDLGVEGFGVLIDAFIETSSAGETMTDGLDAMNQAMEQLKLLGRGTGSGVGALTDAQKEMNKAIQDAQFELDILTGKFADVNEDALRAAYAAGVLGESIKVVGEGAEQVIILDEALAKLAETLDKVKKKQKEVEEAEEKSKDMANDLGIVMESAFTKAVVAGEDLRSVLQGLLEDLIQIALKKLILAPIVGALFGEGGFLTGIIPGFAKGGHAVGGQPAIVGEEGPELFVPSQSGTVVPNGQLGAMNYGAVTVIQQVQVFAPPGSNVEQEQSQDGDIEMLKIFITETVAGDISRTGSSTNRALNNTFGLSRQLTTR